MLKNKQNKTANSDEVLNPIEAHIVIEEQNANNNVSFVVTRGGCRVSDNEYLTPDGSAVVSEKEFWQRVVNRHPDGTKVEIVQFDKKKHRIW